MVAIAALLLSVIFIERYYKFFLLSEVLSKGFKPTRLFFPIYSGGSNLLLFRSSENIPGEGGPLFN